MRLYGRIQRRRFFIRPLFIVQEVSTAEYSNTGTKRSVRRYPFSFFYVYPTISSNIFRKEKKKVQKSVWSLLLRKLVLCYHAHSRNAKIFIKFHIFKLLFIYFQFSLSSVLYRPKCHMSFVSSY